MARSDSTRPTNGGILIADDNVADRTVLRLLLLQAGFDVLEASNGFQALQLIGKWRSAVTTVVANAQMPGLSGPGLLNSIRTFNPDLRCCFMVQGPDDSDASALNQLNPAAIFTKPLELSHVVDVLSSLHAAWQIDHPRN
jgi:CheY-like chemotaxis protein